MAKPLPYEIRTSKTKGQGVFAVQNISFGTIFMSKALLARVNRNRNRNSEPTVYSHVCEINHSRSPNAKCDKSRAGRTEVCTLRDIRRGEEITLSRQDVVTLCAQPWSLSILGAKAID